MADSHPPAVPPGFRGGAAGRPPSRVPPIRRAATLALALTLLAAAPLSVRAECRKAKTAFQPYKPLFAIPYGRDHLYGQKGDGRLEPEAVIQFSAKTQVAICGRFHWEAAYSQRSFWQVWNRANSAPFRETDYNPEVFLEIALDDAGTEASPYWLRLGIEHESNGQPVPLSRSWNRSYATFTIVGDDWAASLKGWDRWDERPKTDPADAGGDDNPDILSYMGSWELRLFGALPPYIEGTLMLRPGKDVHRSNVAIEADLDYLVGGRVWLRLYYFSGYGESLIDYNREVRRIGLGIALKPDLPDRHRVD